MNPQTYLRKIYLTALRYFIAGLLLTIALCSCSKNPLTKKVEVVQWGELITVIGYLEAPVTYQYSYSVDVYFPECDVHVNYLVVIQPGQTQGFAEYQHNCKIGKWEITYQGLLIQRHAPSVIPVSAPRATTN